jgi:hypothetical protein
MGLYAVLDHDFLGRQYFFSNLIEPMLVKIKENYMDYYLPNHGMYGIAIERYLVKNDSQEDLENFTTDSKGFKMFMENVFYFPDDDSALLYFYVGGFDSV